MKCLRSFAGNPHWHRRRSARFQEPNDSFQEILLKLCFAAMDSEAVTKDLASIKKIVRSFPKPSGNLIV